MNDLRSSFFGKLQGVDSISIHIVWHDQWLYPVDSEQLLVIVQAALHGAFSGRLALVEFVGGAEYSHGHSAPFGFFAVGAMLLD